jgi:ectoine hydroxylase-related dioxygenase (phytanoyl-CoA dioxygenase family)
MGTTGPLGDARDLGDFSDYAGAGGFGHHGGLGSFGYPGRADPADTRLSGAQLERFRDEGFLQLDEVCSGAELVRLQQLLGGLFDRSIGYDEGNLFDMVDIDCKGRAPSQPQLLNPSLYAPQLLLTAHFSRMLAIARQVLGEDARFCFDHSIVKRAGTSASTPWHQDEAHHHDPDHEFDQLSFWLPLQDVAEHNGCMRYVPGSNKGAVLPHRSLGGDTSQHALECPTSQFDVGHAQVVPLRRGDCVMHGGRTLHGAGPNSSSADRLAYVLVFRGAPRPRADPARFTWLDNQHTADAERHQHWLRRGGYLVLLLRWLRRQSPMRRLLVVMRRRWRALR